MQQSMLETEHLASMPFLESFNQISPPATPTHHLGQDAANLGLYHHPHHLVQAHQHQQQVLHDPVSDQQPQQAETAFGYLADLQDALLIVQLCLSDKLPLVSRRLTLFERESIRSGSVFAFIESPHDGPSGMVTPPRKRSKDWQPMRRWTDGLSWSKSRVHGHFLVYKEVAEKRSMGNKRPGMDMETGAMTPPSGAKRGRVGRASALLKQDGLMKKTFSIVVDSNVWHVINYYFEEDVERGILPTPSGQFPNVKLMDKLVDPTKLRLRSSGPPRESPHFNSPRASGSYSGSVNTRRSKSSSGDGDDDEYRDPSASRHHHHQQQQPEPATGDFSRLMEAEMGSPDSPMSGNAVNSNDGFITLRQVDPESATVQIPLPSTLKVTF